MLYIIVLVITIAVPMLIQMWLKNTYGRWSKVANTANLTGAEVARAILSANGINNVEVERVAGQLTDHYDPRAKKVRLSEHNYDQPSVAAMAVAAHEVGHAMQHAKDYQPLSWRTAILPVANIGSGFGPWLVMGGVMFQFFQLAIVGLLFFAAAAVFQLVTLPIEFDASKRALSEMKRLGYATSNDTGGSRKVLTAAAMTYVAALASTVAWLLYYALIIFSNRD